MASTSISPTPTTSASAGRSGSHNRPANLAYIGFVHGVIMLVAFAVLFPLGGALLRAFQGRQVARIHAVWQTAAYALAIADFGSGVWVAQNGGRGTFKSSNGHKIMGLIVMIIMTLQPIIGTVHHLLFKKRQTSTWYGVIHRFFGRIAVIAGAINVGLGLMLGPPPVRRIVAYSVLTAVFGTLYVVVTVFFGPEAKKRPNFVASTTNTPREGSIDTTSTANTTGGVEKEATNIIRLREL